MQEPSLAAKLGAEFLGTFLLVFAGCGSVIISSEFLSSTDVEIGIGLLGISLAFGLAVRWPALCCWQSRPASLGSAPWRAALQRMVTGIARLAATGSSPLSSSRS